MFRPFIWIFIGAFAIGGAISVYFANVGTQGSSAEARLYGVWNGTELGTFQIGRINGHLVGVLLNPTQTQISYGYQGGETGLVITNDHGQGRFSGTMLYRKPGQPDTDVSAEIIMKTNDLITINSYQMWRVNQ